MVILEKLKILTKITEALSSFSTQDEIFDFILSSVRAIYGVEYVAILMLDKRGRHIQIVRSCGYEESQVAGSRIRVGEGVTGRVAAKGEPIIIHDVEEEPHYVSGDASICSEMAVPLKVNGRIVGVLSVESTKKQFFSRDDLELFCLFAAQVSAFICHFNLYSAMESTSKVLEQKVHQLINLNGVAKKIISTVSISKILRNILLSLKEVVPKGESFAFLLFDNEKKILVVKSVLGHSEEIVDKLFIPVGRGITGTSFLMKEQLVVSDVRQDNRYIETKGTVVVSEMAIPLVVNGEALGIIDIVSSEEGAFSGVEKDFMDTIISFASVAIGNARLFEENKQAYFQTISSLAEALEARDSYTKGHSERVTKYAMEIASRIGISGRDAELLRYACILHDIGKIGIVDNILHKKGRLDPVEFEIIKSHSSFGEKILKPISFLRDIRLIVKHHHEKYNGTGYPSGFERDDIPFLSRIVAVADAFDAMTSNRPYRDAMDKDEALEELVRNRGVQFDPQVVDAFVEYWRGYECCPTEQVEGQDCRAG